MMHYNIINNNEINTNNGFSTERKMQKDLNYLVLITYL